MKNLFTYLKALWSWGLDSQSTDVSLDRRLTVGSPSGLDAKWKQNPFMRFAVVLTLIFTIGSGNVWGAETLYETITLLDNGTASDGSSSFNASSSTSGVLTPADSVSFTATTSYVYQAQSGLGWKLSSSGSNGTLTFSLAHTIPKVTKIVVNAKRYHATKGTKLNCNSLGQQTLTTSLADYTFTYGSATNISQIVLAAAAASSGDRRCYITTIKIYYDAPAACSTPPTVGSSLSSVSATVNSITATVPISSIGGCNITENGLVYSTSVATPEVGAANCTKVTVTACGSTAANKTVTISDLTCGQGYYVRGYATNAAGTSYTNVTTQSTSACPVYTVTLKDDNSTYTQASYGASVTLPSRTGCTGYTFAGWSTTNNASWTTTAPTIINAGSYTPTANIDLYPVYTKTEGGSEEDHDGPSWIRSGGSNTYTSGYTFATAGSMGSSTDYYQDGSATTGQVKLYHTSTTIFSSTPTSVKLTAKIGGGTGGTSLNTPVYAQLLNSSGTAIGNATEITSYITTNTGDTYTDVELDLTGITSAYGVMVYHAKQTSYNVRYYSFSLTYTTGGSTTYYISVPNCCTQLASINGSNNLTITPAANSITVAVKTDGVGAYGDASNVSGYEFKLYTSAEGGSAAASYSSASSAGTSHEFTGLTPLTQYWVTVRPIGSGSYCNTTAESDRVAIYTCPGSPNHVDVSGRWDRFGGETISLTAAAYATAGTGTAIPAAKITGYQWQKWYNSQWNNISNAGTTSGATTNNLQITSCSNENSGSYRCVVSTVAGCDIASDGFQVKVYVLECYTGGTTTYNFTRVGDTQAGTAQITLTAGNKEFKVHADNDYYGKNETINEDVTNVVLCNSGDAVCSSNLTIAAGLGGTFTINMEYSTSGSSSVEGEPEISVTYPRKTIYLTPGVWNSGEAKFAFYYFRKVGETIYGEGFTDFITADDCGSSADIPQWNGVKINAVRLNSNTTASDLTNSANHYKAAWDKKWNQTSDITITSNNSISITGWGPDNGDSPYDYGTYAVPTYTISYATGSVPTGGGSISGSKANETKTCGVDFDLPAAQFTTTGYVQTGWAKTDGGAQYAAVSGSYTDNSAQTFYPVWTANTHTLTWDKNGGDALTGDYTSGTVAYATAITAPNTPTRTGYSFDGWHNGSSIVTPATTMPDNDLSYTAQWSLASYTVTLNTNGGTIKAGNVTSYTYGTGATLPTNVTRDGYRFDGWFSDDGVWSDQVTAISTTATGDKTYYAKWTQVYTVTWSVNGETWSSGVVDGNTYVVDGQRVSALPTAPTTSDCDDSKVFVGWRATAIDGTSTSDPGGIFTTQAGSPAIDADKTFYAVFADESGGDYTRVTSTSQLVANTKIVMGYEADYASNPGVIVPVQSAYFGSNLLLTGTTDGSAGYGTIDMSTLTYAEGANYAFTLKAGYNSGYWTFEMSGDQAGKYFGYNNRNAVAQFEAIQTDGKTDYSIALGTNDVATIINKYGNENTYYYNSKNRYYKYLRYNYNNGNPRVVLYETGMDDMVLYIGNPLVYSNYVTTCASCDENATYTNTTPTVSDIDCTGATLTMEDGLATVGADGCHVSDYGFVIGTSDNPAVGGDGVTKLQVGTSDPTIGEDFSYDATGLTKGTHYYIRAYATNRHGTAYSTSTNFWTKNVSSIAITTAPTKTNYLVGETFDATGMVVTATMASGATEDVTSDVTYSSSALTAGTNQDFAIEYTLCETDKSVNQKINVYTLSVSEGTNPSYGTAAGSVNVVSITGLGEHKTYTVTVTSDNATAVDNGDNTWTITNPTGNVAVRVDYADAVQVKVYYKVDGVTVTGLTQDVYQSETTTLPTASELATAMTAQSMDIPDDDYPNFYGWSETEFPAQTAEPTIVTGTPTINAEKTYYAVYTNINKKSITPSAFSSTYASNDGENTIDGVKYEVSNICTQSSKIQFRSSPGYLYTKEALAYIKKIEITGLDLIVNACSDNAGTLDGDAITPTGTAPYVYTFPASKQYFKIKGKGGTDKVSLIEIFYANTTVYYMTEFCATKVTLSHNSPEHGTVEFSRSSLATCGSDKNVALIITPDAGYKLTGWTVNTASGYADAKTTSPAVVTTNNNSAAQNITLTFAQDANKNYDVTATFGLMTVESWTWTHNSAAIPNPLNLYIGQSARLDVAYTPAGVDNSKKTYTRTKEDAYINWVGVAQSTYTTISGRASTGENTTPVTFTHGDGPTTTVNVKVLPLPLVHFGDIVHNVSFDDVVATLSDNTLSPTKTTPTHADFDGATKNTCEEEHLHLVGWIREDWPSLVTYLNGGAKPSTDDITGAGNDGSGNAYFFTPGASINTQTFNGVTFYAVWAKVE